jgi:thioredoxin reductase (NADPH)
MLTTEVENYPGFSKGIKGPDLMDEMRKQTERFGAKIHDTSVSKIDLQTQPFTIKTETTEFRADAVIVATGASAKWLGLDSEQRLRGKGVSSCATCDGFFFRGQEVVVVGGGDSAAEEALFLSKLCSQVTIIHRRSKLRASKILQDRLFGKENVKFEWDTVVEEVLGSEAVEGVKIKNSTSGMVKTIACKGVFIAIGHKPNTELFAGQLELDADGYLKVHDGIFTNVEGVYAAGDVFDYVYRQAVTAAASGCKAALEVIKYLEIKEVQRYTVPREIHSHSAEEHVPTM